MNMTQIPNTEKIPAGTLLLDLPLNLSASELTTHEIGSLVCFLLIHNGGSGLPRFSTPQVQADLEKLARLGIVDPAAGNVDFDRVPNAY